MSKRIFISYSHLSKDTVCAKALEHFLVSQKCEVWIDYNHIKGGDIWAADIDVAIQKSDAVIVILSKNSIQSEQVLREIKLALKRTKEKDTFTLLFVTIGQFHNTWFNTDNIDNRLKHNLNKYLSEHQYIQLKPNGALTIASTNTILSALNHEKIYVDKTEDDCNKYVFDEGDPQPHQDNYSKNKHYHRLHMSDLSPSTTVPYVMDNQWLPNEILEDKHYRELFLKEGFHSPDIQTYMETYRNKHLYLSLMFNRQLVLNRAALLNNHLLQNYYSKLDGFNKNEQKAFKELLNDGSIIAFFYDDDLIDPKIEPDKLDYSVRDNIIKDWNTLVRNTSMYCMRENWSREVDYHKVELTKFSETISLDERGNELLAENFKIKNKKEFYLKLKEIEEVVFNKTHENKKDVDMYNRSGFYRDFVVDNAYEGNAVLDCIFDQSKEFHLELKKIIDIYYNSIFINLLHCNLQIPMNTSPKDIFIYQHFLHHGNKELDPDELEYAFVDFFDNTNVLSTIKKIGNRFNYDYWTLNKIYNMRKNAHWSEYIELLEYILIRSTSYQIDLCKIEQLLDELSKCMIATIDETKDIPTEAAYTFRICIGNYVIDAIETETNKKLVLYPGGFYGDGQNHLSIYFLIGDTTIKDPDMLYPQLKIFNGCTNLMSGESYVTSLKKVFKKMGFKEVN